ncbi:MAG: hypothetical protein KKH12_16190 [Gammaproteobacteria bacterium]|nr:hypothetical protein [Gammaproteobacteria bacterium]
MASADKILTLVMGLARRGGVAPLKALDHLFGGSPARRSAVVGAAVRADFVEKRGTHWAALTDDGIEIAEAEGVEVDAAALSERLDALDEINGAAARPSAPSLTTITLDDDVDADLRAEAARTGLTPGELLRRAWVAARGTISEWPSMSGIRVRPDKADQYDPRPSLDLSRRTGISSVPGLPQIDEMIKDFELTDEELERRHARRRSNVHVQRSEWLGRLLKERGPMTAQQIADHVRGSATLAETSRWVKRAREAGVIKRIERDLYAHVDFDGRLPDSFGVSSISAAILVEMSKKTMSIAEVAIRLNEPRPKIAGLVSNLVKSGRIRRLGEGRYRTVKR